MKKMQSQKPASRKYNLDYEEQVVENMTGE